ncbi:MAG: lytic transglycosylase domain-containing protein [Bryobacteraceae bacterium]|jgi:soluble lytic murein transglycosylase-like protein
MAAVANVGFRVSGLWAANAAGDVPAARPVKITSVVQADARTGKLVRNVVVAPRTVTRHAVAVRPVAASEVTPRVVPPADAAAAPGSAGNWNEKVAQIAAQHDLPAELLHSVIKVESNYNPRAVSPKGALGMMQLIPATAERFGVSDVFDPVDNIQGGARYLRYLLDLYHGDYPLALAAYNAGEQAVAKYGSVPPYAETQTYLRLVAREIQQTMHTTAAQPKQTKPAETKPEGPAHIEEIVEPDGTVHYVSR